MKEQQVLLELCKLGTERKEYRSRVICTVKNLLDLQDNDRLEYVDDYINNWERYFMLDIDERSDYAGIKACFVVDDSCDKYLKIFDIN